MSTEGTGAAIIPGGLLTDDSLSATALLVYAAVSYAPRRLDWGVIMRQARVQSMDEIARALEELGDCCAPPYGHEGAW